jgi:tight adherence protein B
MRRLFQLVLTTALSSLGVAALAAPASAQVPADQLEVMLAVDTSASMRHAIEAAKAAAGEFVASMPADVRIGIETFGDDVSVLATPTTDRALLTEQIGAITTDGDTALYDAVVVASQQFTPDAQQKVLVLLSDGKDDGSAATLDEAVAAVEGEHVEAISLTTDETDLASLQALGAVTSADDVTGVSAAFARVADLLAQGVEPAAQPITADPPTTLPATTTPPATTSPQPATTTPPPTTVYSRPPAPAVTAAEAVDGQSSLPLVLGGLGIFAGLFVAGLLLFPRQRVSKARLGTKQPRNVSGMGLRPMSAVDEFLERHGKRADLATALSVADISMPAGRFAATVGLVAVVAGLVGLLVGGPLLALGVALVVCLGTRFYVRRRESKRRTAFADQLPEILQLVTTALRSGFGMTQALESVAEEAEEPARSEFAHVLVEARLGRDLTDSMRALAVRMASQDLEWVVSAIDINRDTGGNLSEVLATVSATIRERQRMARHVLTLTAEGRMSARVLTVLPVGMALWQWRTNPDSFSLLLHGKGFLALLVAGVFLLVGSFWIRRIVNSITL